MTMINKDAALTAMIEAMTPRGLDDIIRKNREHCQVRHATDADLAPLLGEVPAAYPKLVITDWRLVTIALTSGDRATVLLGDICDGSGNTWITNKITSLDLQSGYLRTASGSLYMMAKRGEGEPSFEQLALLCTYVSRGGFGRYFGVPEFFY